MGGKLWSAEDEHLVANNLDASYKDLVKMGLTRSYDAWKAKRRTLLQAVTDEAAALLYTGDGGIREAIPIIDNSRAREMDWRRWNDWIKEGQILRKEAKGSPLEEARIQINTAGNVSFIVLGDTHIGAWSTDHDLFERITDEILAIPNLYIALLGDMAHMAIKLRNVVEVGDNLLPGDLQLLYLSSWLETVRERVLFAVWGNHEVERAEAQAGVNPFGDIYKKAARHYFNGIGHLIVEVNGIPYKIAASHHFRGRSMYSPVHGAQRYLTFEAQDREIAIAGDSHVPGIMKFTTGELTKLAVNCGSIQTMSGYAQRYFSLVTHPVFPVITLDGSRKNFWANWNVDEWQSAQGMA